MIEYKVVVWDNGAITWFKPGTDIRHRIGGPAVTNQNGNFWFIDDQFHREDGPAVEYHNGDDNSWYLHCILYDSEADWKVALNPVKELTVAEISEMLGFEVKVVK